MLSFIGLLKALGFRKREEVRIEDEFIREKTRAGVVAIVELMAWPSSSYAPFFQRKGIDKMTL